MPSGPLRLCAGGCGTAVASGRCQACTSRHGTKWERYGSDWQALRERVRRRLIALGIPPVCGARLPGAPLTAHSRCSAEGRDVHASHYDHIVAFVSPRDPRRLDPLNIQLLCTACHSRKTATEDRGYGN